MRKVFTLVALGSVALLSADQYSGNSNYQGQPTNSNYYPQNPRQGAQGYYQRDNVDANYQGQTANDNYYQQNQRQGSQGYYQRNNVDGNYQGQVANDNSYQQNQRPGSQGYYQRDNQQCNPQQGNQRGNNPRNVSDQDLNKKIQDTLSSGWFSKGFKNVSFDVNNGTVNLRGTVDSQENKQKIEDNIRKIDGVRQVNNQITVVKENT